MKTKVVSGSFSDTVVCPICGAKVFVNYKGRVSMARCLEGHLIFIREKPRKAGIVDDRLGG